MPVPETYAGKVTKTDFIAVAALVNDNETGVAAGVSALTAHEAAADPHPLYLLESDASAAYVERAGVQSATVTTSEGTTSTTYADLATVGPAVTATVGASGKVLVLANMQSSHSTTTDYALAAVAVSGATTRAAADAEAMGHQVLSTGGYEFSSIAVVISGLNAGSNTFTVKYKVGAGTGTFQRRRLTVIPL